MEIPASKAGDSLDLLRNPPEFSLVLGGPLYQLLRRAHLSDDALMMVRQRIIVFALLAWLPPLLLAALEGDALQCAVVLQEGEIGHDQRGGELPVLADHHGLLDEA